MKATVPYTATAMSTSDVSAVQSLTRQIEPSEVVVAKKQKTSVRFHVSTPALPPVPNLAAISIPSSLDLFDGMRRDICDYIRHYIRRPVSEGVSVRTEKQRQVQEYLISLANVVLHAAFTQLLHLGISYRR